MNTLRNIEKALLGGRRWGGRENLKAQQQHFDSPSISISFLPFFMVALSVWLQFYSVCCITVPTFQILYPPPTSFPTCLTTPYCIFQSPSSCYCFQNCPITHFSHILMNGIPPWYENGAFWLIGSKEVLWDTPSGIWRSIVQS